jgi:hypothetical protein
MQATWLGTAVTFTVALLLSPTESPWTKLYRYSDASSFLIMTGMTCQAFMELFDILFVDCNQQHNMAGRGMPLLLDPGLEPFLCWQYYGYQASLHDFWCYALSL